MPVSVMAFAVEVVTAPMLSRVVALVGLVMLKVTGPFRVTAPKVRPAVVAASMLLPPTTFRIAPCAPTVNAAPFMVWVTPLPAPARFRVMVELATSRKVALLKAPAVSEVMTKSPPFRRRGTRLVPSPSTLVAPLTMRLPLSTRRVPSSPVLATVRARFPAPDLTRVPVVTAEATALPMVRVPASTWMVPVLAPMVKTLPTSAVKPVVT